MRLIRFLAIIGLTLVSVPTLACRTADRQYSLFRVAAPSALPEGAVALRVFLIGPPPHGHPIGGMIVKVVHTQGEDSKIARLPDEIKILPRLWTSCTNWGAEKGDYAFVVGHLRSDQSGDVALMPVDDLSTRADIPVIPPSAPLPKMRRQ